VSQAAGLVPARGDSIQVTALPFDATAAAQDAKALPKAAASGGGMLNLLETGALLVGLILVVAAAVRGARRVERTPLLLPAERLELEAARRALASGELRQLDNASTLALPAPRTSFEDAEPAVSAELEGLVDRQPEEVAALLRGWLAEKR
jgi:flagellar M-ring protein FliF